MSDHLSSSGPVSMTILCCPEDFVHMQESVVSLAKRRGVGDRVFVKPNEAIRRGWFVAVDFSLQMTDAARMESIHV